MRHGSSRAQRDRLGPLDLKGRRGGRLSWRVLMSLCVLGVCEVSPQFVESARAFDVTIGGEARILADIQAAGTAVQVAGSLRDELGEPLRQHELMLRVNRQGVDVPLLERTLTTDMQGRFEFQEDFSQAMTLRVSLELLPSKYILADQSISRVVELRPTPATIQVQVPRVVVGQEEPAMLRVRAAMDGVGIKTPVRIDISGTALTEPLQLNHYGRGVLDLRPYLQDGQNLLSVKLDSDLPSMARANTMEREVFYTSRAFVAGEVEQAFQRLDRGIRAHGSVRDVLGEPLGSGQVEVIFQHIPIASIDTEERSPFDEPAAEVEYARVESVRVEVAPDGRFEAFLPGTRAEDGLWRSEIVYRPDVGASVTSVTPSFMLDRSGSRMWLNVLGFAAILFGLAVLVWRVSLVDFEELLDRVRAAIQGRGRSVRKRGDLEDAFLEEERLVVEQMEVPADLKRSTERDISGVIWDIWRGRVVSGARVSLHADAEHRSEPVCEGIAREDGRFVLRDIEEGRWFMRVTATGFAPGTMELIIPHAGEHGYFRLGLVAMPLKMRRYYQAWVQRLQGKDLWGKLTPRQIEQALLSALEDPAAKWVDARARREAVERLKHLLSEGAHEEEEDPLHLIALVTQIVEESYFSGRVEHPDSAWDDLLALTARIERLLEQAREGQPSPAASSPPEASGPPPAHRSNWRGGP